MTHLKIYSGNYCFSTCYRIFDLNLQNAEEIFNASEYPKYVCFVVGSQNTKIIRSSPPGDNSRKYIVGDGFVSMNDVRQTYMYYKIYIYIYI